jgi:ketosteroid isomerase-like protein
VTAHITLSGDSRDSASSSARFVTLPIGPLSPVGLQFGLQSGPSPHPRRFPLLEGVGGRAIIRGAMSLENVEAVKRSYDAFSRGDFAAALEAFDPEVQWEVTPEAGLEPGVFRGYEGVRRAIGPWAAEWKQYRVGTRELIDRGPHVIAVMWDEGVGATSGVKTRREFALVHTFRNGKIVHTRHYRTRKEALEAAGLRE